MIQIIEGTIFIEDLEVFLRKLKAIARGTNSTILALDADKLAGEKHIRFALQKALYSFKAGRNTAKTLDKEIMLYAAGTRQINKAIGLGIHNGHNNIALVAIGEQPCMTGLDEISPASVIGYTDSKKKSIMQVFEITQKEIDIAGEEKIPELVLERVALVDVIK